jgi:hypothetical protein
MDADDVLEAFFGFKAQSDGAFGVKIAGPAGDDFGNCLVRLAADELDGVISANSAERFKLLGHGAGKAGEREGAAVLKSCGIQFGGLNEKLHGSAGRSVPMAHGVAPEAASTGKGSRMMFEKNPEAARFGFPGRTQIVGMRSATPSKKPRRE